TLQEASVFGKRFGNGGGVTEAVLQCLRETDESTDIEVMKCDGAAECKKALLLLKMGKLPADFIEGMACQGGCVGGPSRHQDVNKAKKARDFLIGSADDRKVHENLKNYDMDSFSMHRNHS
ncbi:MAG: ferredoxin, partial [Lachnospiraceae bacterium]|nr:ferredoxin [Lachnospiraceae bacterium]